MCPPVYQNADAPPSPLRAHLHVSSSGYFEHLAGHYMHRPSTSNYLLLWVTQGKGHVESQNQRHQAQAGDLIVLDRGPAQTYGADEHEPWSLLWVHFMGPASRSFFEQLRKSPRMAGKIAGHLGLPSQQATVQHRFEEMVNSARQASADRVMLQECLLAGLLGLIIHQLNQPAINQTGGSSGGGLRHDMAAILRYIDEHLHELLTVEQLARQSHLSKRQLHRLFSRRMGMTPLSYMQNQRMNKASVLLGQTDLPINEIAA